MITLVIIGLVAVICIGVVWSRVGLSRSERRSMKNYEHTLHVLGDVARRSDAAAKIRPLGRETVEHGHVRGDIEPIRLTPPSPPPARPRLQPPPTQPFADEEGADRRPADARAQPPRRDRRKAPRTGRLVELPWGKISSVAAGLLICAGLALAGLEVSKGSTPHHLAVASVKHHHHATHPATTTRRHRSRVKPTSLAPVSTNPSVVSFVAPQGKYRLFVSVNGGTCWVGIQQTAGGPFVWQGTLDSGQSETYEASGAVVVRVGAPKYLAVKVNGIPAELPAYEQPYDLVFNPSAQSSTA